MTHLVIIGKENPLDTRPHEQSLCIHTTGFVTGLADALRSTLHTLEVFCLPRPAEQWLQLAAELPALTTLLVSVEDDEGDSGRTVRLPPALLLRGALHALTLHNLSDGFVQLDDELSRLQRLTMLDVQHALSLPPAIR